MRGCKLTLHVHGGPPGWAARFVASGVRYIKLMDLPDKDPWPGVRTIGRVYVPDNESNAMVWRGAPGADEWWALVGPIVRSRPWVWAWEGPNEPQPIAVREFRAALDAFTVRLAELMHAEGVRLVGLNFGVGGPDVGQGPEFRRSLAVIDLLGLHEYNAPRLDTVGDGGVRYWVGRYRMLVKELRAAGCRVPPILIGEHGIDLGVWTPQNPDVRPQRGWQAIDNDPAGYAWQLAWADQNIYSDSIVEAVCIFTAAAGNPWESFNVTEPLADRLAAFVRANPPQFEAVPAPVPADPIIVNLAGQLPTKGHYGTRALSDIQFTVLHHAATPNADTIPALLRVRRIAEYHIGHWGWAGIGYHFVVARDGTIYQVNSLTTVSNHTGGANLHGAGVCLLGTYTKEAPPAAQAEAAARLVKHLGWPMYDHKHFGGTVCPGVAGDAVRAALARL